MGHFLCPSDMSERRWPTCIEDKEPRLQSGGGGPAPSCSLAVWSKLRLQSGWTQCPGFRSWLSAPGATCQPQVWGPHARQHLQAHDLFGTPPHSP